MISTADLQQKLAAFKKVVDDNKNSTPPEEVKKAFLGLCEAAASLDDTFHADIYQPIDKRISAAIVRINNINLSINDKDFTHINNSIININDIFKEKKTVNSTVRCRCNWRRS